MLQASGALFTFDSNFEGERAPKKPWLKSFKITQVQLFTLAISKRHQIGMKTFSG